MNWIKRLAVVVVLMLSGLLTGTAYATTTPVITIDKSTSSWYGYDESPEMTGPKYPTVGVNAHVDVCLQPEFRRWDATMTQYGKVIQRVYSGANSEGEIEYCPDTPGLDLRADFGGRQLKLFPGRAQVTFTVYTVADGDNVPVVTTTSQVIVPSEGFRIVMWNLIRYWAFGPR